MAAVLILSIAVKIWQALFNIHIGKKIDSLTLAATGADSRNDVIATSAVLAGILVDRFFSLQIDGYVGCLVALFILWSGISLIKETASPLLGEAPDPQLVDAIRDMTLSYEGVLGIHDLVVHNYGPGKIFASLHVEVDADGDLMESHDMVDNIERELAEKLCIQITCHLDPIRINDPLVRQMTDLAEKTAAGIEGVSNIHDLRIVKGPTHTNVIFDVAVSPECKASDDEVRKLFEDAVKRLNSRYFVVINFDRSYIKLD